MREGSVVQKEKEWGRGPRGGDEECDPIQKDSGEYIVVHRWRKGERQKLPPHLIPWRENWRKANVEDITAQLRTQARAELGKVLEEEKEKNVGVPLIMGDSLWKR